MAGRFGPHRSPLQEGKSHRFNVIPPGVACRTRRGHRGMSSAKAQTVPSDSTLLDILLEPGRLSVVFQPMFEVSTAIPQLFALECLTRGPRGTNAERPEVLFEYVRNKRAETAESLGSR